jgi:hypothetical protein
MKISFHQKEFKDQIATPLGGRVVEEIAECDFFSH